MPVKCYFNGDHLDGVFHNLFTSNQDNYQNIVQASASSTRNGYDPKFAVDFNSETIWHPNCDQYPDPGQYIQIDLQGYYVTLEAYAIQTSNLGAGSAHPRDWSFSASYDKVSWSQQFQYIDEDQQMNNNLRKLVIPVHLPGKYKHFRITVTGESHTTSNSDPKSRMDVNQIELFGVLYHDYERMELPFSMCSRQNSLIIPLFLIYLFI